MDYKSSISYASQALGIMNRDLVKEVTDYHAKKINNF